MWGGEWLSRNIGEVFREVGKVVVFDLDGGRVF